MNIKKIIKNVKPLHYIWRKYDWFKTKRILSKDVRILPNNIFRKVFGRNIDWENPKSLIEKIYWMQLYTDTSLWTKCADKYRVREYVKEKGCEDILNTLYGKWDNAKDIDWDSLPNSFVLKTNNSCGQVIIVKDKRSLDIPKTIKRLNNWLDLKYGYRDAQFHYTRIKPCIVAEKLLENQEDTEKSLVDYKIWCFNGVPESILVVHNRTKENYLVSFFDLEWNNISEKTLNKNSKHISGIEVPKPKSFEKMIECAKKLSKGIPQVRIDFYDVEGKAVFGEMTFTTGFGSYKEEYYNYLGSKIDLSKLEKLDQPNNPLK